MATKTTPLSSARRLARLLLLGRLDGDGRTATVHAEIDAPAADVYATLADAQSYADWVVGAKEIRRWDEAWPAAGAMFHHTQGTAIVNIKDTTSVMEVDPGQHLLLEVRARPLVVARTEFFLEPLTAQRTRVTMLETPTSGLLRAVDNPLLTGLAVLRNQEALRRLRNVVLKRAARDTD